ncbi:DcaP family trimeric outer membrane transporter [Candidatus Paracaedibacter symbiosus]|uniref:DcaP family trimeric outer membrane transporter n=1 Tax=Candidatus Paracaedibacter symbiosus TaxID=244582 RepID=UPI0005094556|nr:DcaP family trimeric outer membrane transporter [Candidatus Paracaedibacter symbiosus]
MTLPKGYFLAGIIAGTISPAFAETSFSANTYTFSQTKKDDANKTKALAGKIGDMYLQVGGRVKADFYYDANGRQPGSTYGLDVAALPLDGVDFNAKRTGNFNGSLTASRINVDVYKEFGRVKSHGFIELDFNGNASTTTNSYGPRMRFAYGEVMDENERHILLIGQTWTNFANIDADPRTLNNVPPSYRTIQMRYTNRVTPAFTFAAAIERPNVQYFQNTGTSATSGYTDNDGSFSNSKSSLPDLTMQVKFKNKAGQLSLSGVARSLQVKAAQGFNGALSNLNHRKFGWGVGVAGVLEAFEPVKLMGQIIGGKGTGRYIDDLCNQNALDSYFQYPTTGNTTLASHFEAVKAIYYNAGVMINWTKSLNSTIGGAYTKVFTPQNMTATASTNTFHKTMQRYHVNLIYSLLPNNEVGIEVEHYRRKAGTPVAFNGRDTRVLVSYIYNF